MAIRKVKDIVLYADDDYYCGPGPAVVVFPDGEMAAVFRRHRSWTKEVLRAHVHPTTEQCLIRSTDGGETWSSTPRVFMGGGQCAVAGLLKDGTMLFVTHRQESVPIQQAHLLVDGVTTEVAKMVEADRRAGLIDPADQMETRRRHWPAFSAGTEIWRSDDRGDSWNGPAWVGEVPDLPPLAEGLHAPVHLRGFPQELSNGDVVLPVQGRGIGSILAASTDGGNTWHYRGVAAPNQKGESTHAFNEWSVYETAAGDLVGFVRSGRPSEEGGGYLWTVRSKDKGFTWSEPKQEEVWGHPYFALRLPSGNVMIVYGYRREPYGIRCRVLDPECTDPSGADEFVLRDDGGGVDVGYPHATVMPDGRVFIIYYYHDREGGQRFCAGSIVEAS